MPVRAFRALFTQQRQYAVEPGFDRRVEPDCIACINAIPLA
jgi:hypothetical protein